MSKIVVDDNLVRYLLSLSMIDIEDSEYERFKSQIQRILDYMEMLDEVDTEGVSPMFGGIECPLYLRLDIAREGIARISAIQNAPSAKEGLFEIPKVIE